MSYKITNPVTGYTAKTAWGKRAWDAEMAFQTDAVNYQMFQEQNDFNLGMYERQRADAQTDWLRDTSYNEKMLADQRAYDSPAAQRQRLLEAGYNPLMIGSAGFSGGSSSAISAPSENTPDAPSSASWAGATKPQDNAPGVLDILNSVVGALSSLAGTAKTATETIELPQYVFNDTQRAASENSLRNMMLRKMFQEQPFWQADMQADIAYKNASSAAQKWVAAREEATKKFIEEQTAWLPDISRATIDELSSRYAANWKNIQVADETINSIVQEIAESNSREAINWESVRGQKIQNDLTEKYGPQQSEAAIRAYDDAHANYLVNLLMTSVNIKKEDRQLWLNAMKDAGIYSKEDLEDFLDTIMKIKNGAVLSPREQQRWYEPISALLPSLVAAGYLGGKVVTKAASHFGQRAVAPLVLPETNIYGQPVYNRSWGTPSLYR